MSRLHMLPLPPGEGWGEGRTADRRRPEVFVFGTPRDRNRRQGYTILEVVLALSLTIVVMSAIGMAIFLHLRAVDNTRVAIERDQLARTLMRRIGDDIRSTVRREPFDDAGLQSLLSSAKGAAGALAGAAGGGAAGGSSSGSPSTGETGRPGTTRSAGTTKSAGTAKSLSSTGEATTEEDPAAAGAPAAIAGLYGTAMELQIDIARVPRPDEIAEAMLSGATAPSDIKTVYYFLAQTATGATVSGATGLMRSEMNRATALFAAENGDYEIFTQNAQPLASEVVGLQFRYFDGLEWFTEWSSQERNGLPMAIEIALVIVDLLSADESLMSGAIIDPTLDDVDPELVYHTVVHLPNAQLTQPFGETGETSESTADQSTTGAGANSSASGSGGNTK